jgi:hypothetical protein
MTAAPSVRRWPERASPELRFMYAKELPIIMPSLPPGQGAHTVVPSLNGFGRSQGIGHTDSFDGCRQLQTASAQTIYHHTLKRLDRLFKTTSAF